MMYLKACPKCKGDVFEEEDRFGKYSSCAQCGYSKEQPSSGMLAALMQEVPTAKRPGRPAGHKRFVAAGGR